MWRDSFKCHRLVGWETLNFRFALVNNICNRIEFNEDTRCIAFSVREADMEDNNYGSIAFCVDSIVDISGCDDKDNPDEYLNVNIRLQNNTTVTLKILY